MTRNLVPERCLLCGTLSSVRRAEFQQIYGQRQSTPQHLSWWECGSCRGWFVFPSPTPDEIASHCSRAVWNDPNCHEEIGRDKGPLFSKILAGLRRRTKVGTLLDFGCGFGDFMMLARDAGWLPCGFDPNEVAANTVIARGLEVRCKWELAEGGFPEAGFDAITAIDSLSLVTNPYETLQTFHRLLRPSGVLAMRLTNKRAVLGLARAVLRSGSDRDAKLSRMLQGQFHSISMPHLGGILRKMGFSDIGVEPQAAPAPSSRLPFLTKTAYRLAWVVSLASLSKVNVSPGVLLFAQKGALCDGLNQHPAIQRSCERRPALEPAGKT